MNCSSSIKATLPQVFIQVVFWMFVIFFWAQFRLFVYCLSPVSQSLTFSLGVMSCYGSFVALSAANVSVIQIYFGQVYSKRIISSSMTFNIFTTTSSFKSHLRCSSIETRKNIADYLILTFKMFNINIFKISTTKCVDCPDLLMVRFQALKKIGCDRQTEKGLRFLLPHTYYPIKSQSQ